MGFIDDLPSGKGGRAHLETCLSLLEDLVVEARDYIWQGELAKAQRSFAFLPENARLIQKALAVWLISGKYDDQAEEFLRLAISSWKPESVIKAEQIYATLAG